jgi:hypothetical protein
MASAFTIYTEEEEIVTDTLWSDPRKVFSHYPKSVAKNFNDAPIKEELTERSLI